MATINVALIGQGFMGRSHSNAWGQVAKFFKPPLKPVMHTVFGQPQEKPEIFAANTGGSATMCGDPPNIIIGTAFGRIVTSLVNDVLMPPIGLLMGKVDFSSLFWNLSGSVYPSLAEAKKAGAPVIGYGVFLNTILDFVVVALVIFLLIKQVNRFKKEPAPAAPNTKDCPYCLSAVPIKATRCGHCTSQLPPA